MKPIKMEENGIRNNKGQFIEGHPAISTGRPAFSITEEQKKFYQEHPKEFIAFLRDMRNKDRFWEKMWAYTDGLPKESHELSGNLTIEVINYEKEKE